jgi:choline dehydrogenase-like flavoprotein
LDAGKQDLPTQISELGVNPQLTILAIAEKSAEWIAADFGKFRE